MGVGRTRRIAVVLLGALLLATYGGTTVRERTSPVRTIGAGLAGAVPASSLTLGPVQANPSAVDVDVTTQISVSVTGASGPFTYAWSNLPAGCSPVNLSAFSCTPTGTGNFGLQVQVSNGSSTASSSGSLTVNPAPAISNLLVSPASPSAGQTVNFQAQSSGGTPTIEYQWSGLPNGCGGNVSSFGCSLSQGSYSVGVEMSDRFGQTAQRSQSFSVSSSGSNNGGGSNHNNSSSGNNNGNSSKNGFNPSSLLSGLGGLLELIVLVGIVGFVGLILTAIGTVSTAVIVARRLPPRPKGGWTIECPACTSRAPAGSKFCPACGKPIAPAAP